MSKPKYIIGSDPGVYRGPGLYLIVDPDDPEDYDHPDSDTKGPGRSSHFSHDLLYAGPIETDPPDPPATPIVMTRGRAAWKGPGIYIFRYAGEFGSQAHAIAKHEPAEFEPDYYYFGPVKFIEG